MRTSKLTKTWWIVCICLVAVSGCQSVVSRSGVGEPERRYALKDSPAQKRQPRTLDQLAGSRWDQAEFRRGGRPPQQIDQPDHRTPGSQRGQGKISFDDVALDDPEIHMDEVVDIDRIQDSNDRQLPPIIESAVHPFSTISPLTDDNQPAANPLYGSGQVVAVQFTDQNQPDLGVPNNGLKRVPEQRAIPPAQVPPPYLPATKSSGSSSLESQPAADADTVVQESGPQSVQPFDPPNSSSQPDQSNSDETLPPIIAPNQFQSAKNAGIANQSPGNGVSHSVSEQAEQQNVETITPDQNVVTITASPESMSVNHNNSRTDHLFADVKSSTDSQGKNDDEVSEDTVTGSSSPDTPVSSLPPAPITTLQSRDSLTSTGDRIKPNSDSVSTTDAAPIHRQDVRTVAAHSTSTSPAVSATTSRTAKAHNGLNPLTWREQLDASIDQLNQSISTTGDQSELEQQVRLIMMRMAAGQALPNPVKITAGTAQEQKYWNHQLTALNLLFGQQSNNTTTTVASQVADQRRRRTQAAQQLELAHSHLSGISTLNLPKTAFASQVLGFGQYTALLGNFRPGQQVLIYCEIENYSLRQENQSNAIQQVAELQGRYTIVDSENRVVLQHLYEPVQDRSHRRRKDFYMFFPVTIPGLEPGDYRLNLSVEDLVGNKIASSRHDLPFTVGGGQTAHTAPRTTRTKVTTRPPSNWQPTKVPDVPVTSARNNMPLPIGSASNQYNNPAGQVDQK